MSLAGEPLSLDALGPGRHFLQSSLWGALKGEFGWLPIVLDAGAAVLSLTRVLPGGLVLTYLPYADTAYADAARPDGVGAGFEPRGALPPDAVGEPATATWIRSTREAAVDAVTRRLNRTPDLVRFEFYGPGPDAGEGSLLSRSPVAVQPPDTVILDLRKTEEELLAEMHPKNRYNVRLAARRGVRVRVAATGDLAAWYGMYRQTAARDRITIHSERYYRRLLELGTAGDWSGSSEPAVRLYLAEHEGELLAGIIVVRHGSGATYLYGASSDAGRNLMPNYALQWRAMLDARSSGACWYDLFGVPPSPDPVHPMHGLYRFKTGFGGEIARRGGCHDAAVRPLRAGAFRGAERVRDFYFHRLRRWWRSGGRRCRNS